MTNPSGLTAALAGRYAIERQLGAGGMATVYLARDVKHDRAVALKVLRPELAAKLGAARFLQEIRISAGLDHPHILTLIDSGESDGFVWYVVPYVRGESLRQKLTRETQLSVEETVRIATQVATALDYAHRHGVIHRDIKPENILLHEGEAVVTDFGIALAMREAGGTRLTETGLSLGTPQYMSPEQATGDRKLDARSDVYSLAAVVYEMLAGEPPHTGPTLQVVVAKLLTERPTRIRIVRDTVPENIDAAVTKALAKVPADRFASAGEFAAALAIREPGPTAGWRRRHVAVAAGVLGAVVLAALGAWGVATWYRSARMSGRAGNALKIVPVTTASGWSETPVFSPDGNELAYAWTGEQNDHAHIYVQLLGAGTPLRLTDTPAADRSPAWSPDGRYIAFVREAGGSTEMRTGRLTGAYYIVPALGGSERKLADAYVNRFTNGRRVDWSPDGKFLAVADLPDPGEPHPNILLIAVDGGQRKALLREPAPYLAAPTFAPDGRTIAFAAGASFLAHDIYVVPVAGGEPRPITSDQRLIQGLSWMPDGKAIVFSSNRGGLFSLWTVAVAGGAPEPVSAAGADAAAPTISRRGNDLAYVSLRVTGSIWKVDGPTATGPHVAPLRLIASSRADRSPDVSADGKKIAFQSNRSGYAEIWSASSDGTDQVQLTRLDSPNAGTPSWSPDGASIAFDSRLEGHADIFVVSASGGSPRRLTTEPFENQIPSWSRDGRWIYFSSNRSGSWQIWRVPAAGGPAVQLTTQGGFNAYEAPDGTALFYWIDGTVWRMPLAGGTSTRVLDGITQWRAWRVIAGGICFVDALTTPSKLRFLDLATHRVRTVAELDTGLGPPWPELATSPDGRWVLYGRQDELQSDIMLLEDFR